MNHGTKFCRLCLKPLTTHHPNVFTPILHLSEGQADIAWVPSNKMLFFPLRHKAPLAFPQMFYLYFYSYTILSDSLSLSLSLSSSSASASKCQNGLGYSATGSFMTQCLFAVQSV
jgi:hypothetical protein